jgi:hypothetical protein
MAAAEVTVARRRKPSRRDDLVPYGAVIAALLAIVFLLRSALRPPQTPPPPSQELSPDAPPDNHDSIVTTFARGQSGTGEGTGTLGGDEAAGTITQVATDAPTPAPPPAACAYGYGNPPRQTFSIYSPPCAPAFVGDNGGATSNGVDRDEIRIVVPGGTEGWVVDDPAADEDSIGNDRTWRVLQKWFNTRYQLYGRKIRFYKLGIGGDPEQRRAQAARIADEIKAFAAFRSGAINGVELARRGVVYAGEGGDQWDQSFTEAHRPYLWTWRANATMMERIAGEYICKRLAHRPAQFASPPYLGQTRKFGIVYDDQEAKRDSGPVLKRAIEEQCPGVVAEMVGFQGLASQDGTYGSTEQATAISKFRQAGVTSVVAPLNWNGMIGFTTTASSQGYFPEYIITAEGLNDHNTLARLMDQKAWTGHAFGISAREIEENGGAVGGGTLTFSDAVRAYREIDPANVPADGPTRLTFYPLEMLVNGMQLAGPNLTPQTLEAALFKANRREGPPYWAAGSGYSPGNYGYATQVGEIWWDPSAVDSGGTAGAYKWTRGGLRWGLGKLPPGETTVFSEGSATRSPDWWSD